MEGRYISDCRKLLEVTRRGGFEGHSNKKQFGLHGSGQSQKTRVYKNGLGQTYKYEKASVGLNEGPSRLAQRRRGFNNGPGAAHLEPSKPRSGLHSRQGTFSGKRQRAGPIGLQEGSRMLDCGRGINNGPGKQGAITVGLNYRPAQREGSSAWSLLAPEAISEQRTQGEAGHGTGTADRRPGK
ncbi:hypothetical protein F0562_026207 [Nyssa sinensis]|uniref:Uncharacterized protein n=1 Tax=Nyssa sinensis TaxID=561372 RepID=A0A5J5B8E9_9ASTE|nr:hypothetical protein F0562_026207 [Nyssa sinensis]